MGKTLSAVNKYFNKLPCPRRIVRRGLGPMVHFSPPQKAPFCLKTPLALHIQVNTRKTCIYQRNEVVFIKNERKMALAALALPAEQCDI